MCIIDRAYTESYNGTSWTEVNDLGTARSSLGSATQGTTTAGLAFGGYDGSATNKTELWNGSNWTEVNNLTTTRTSLRGSGTSTAGLAFGGQPIGGETES